MEQTYIPKQDYKVLVNCMTFNQSKYIEDALNGFAMQKTNFPFVCLVMDDCSTDGEQEVIKEWMQRECNISIAETTETELFIIILVPHKSNVNCTFAFYLLKQNLYHLQDKKNLLISPWREHSIYEAMCEGDDYWIDPLKLQKQVDVMDSNPEYMMCGTNALILWEKNVEQPNYFNSLVDSRELTPKEALNHWIIPSPALFYRTDVLDEINKWIVPLPFGDIPLIFTALNLGKVYCLSDVTCVYRKLYGGSIVYNAGRKRGNLPHQLAIRACYEEFDKYSEGKFHDIIAEKLKSVNNKIHFLELKKKSKVMAAIMHPQITWRLVTNLLYLKYKRKYQIINKSIG